jgi:hypothetical protein
MLVARDLAPSEADGSDTDARAEHLGAHDETDEDEEHSEQVSRKNDHVTPKRLSPLVIPG